MFGPLPRRHSHVIAFAVLAICLAAGLWMGASPAVPVLVSGGLAMGLATGLVLSWLAVHTARHNHFRSQ
ncbi:hypothetical protein [Nocardioides gilvus]|uniref:hypothetical protein n=1 Tax=Nocardioides gilvus TaxID=1735589 RepID=UPI000D74615C|nr:hypothetical protein [Nocardioides gilvus]